MRSLFFHKFIRLYLVFRSCLDEIVAGRKFAVVRRNSDYQRKYDVSVANKNYFKNSLVIS